MSSNFGRHGQIGKVQWLATAEATFPTGDYDARLKANPGNGDTLLGAGLRLTAPISDIYSLDTTILYSRIFERDSGKDDSNQMSVSVTPGVKFGSKWRAGVETTVLTDFKDTIKFGAGPIARFSGDWGNITAGFSADLYGNNTTTGATAYVRVRIPLEKLLLK